MNYTRLNKAFNNYIPIILLSIYISSFCSCNRDTPKIEGAYNFSFDDFPQQKKLNAKKMLNSELLEDPHKIYVKDSVLFIINGPGSDFLLHSYNTITKERIGASIEVGIGPEEMIYCNNLQFFDNKLYLNDMQQNKFIVYDYDDLIHDSFCNPDSIFYIKNIHPQNPLLLSNIKFVGNDLTAEGQLISFFNINGEREEKSIPYPYIEGKEYESDFHKKRSFECRMITDFENVYITYVYTDLIDFFDANGNLKRRISGPESYPPYLYEKRSDGGNFVSTDIDKTKVAYMSPNITKDYLWVLYYGSLPQPDIDFLSNKILVFDKEGNPKYLFELDQPILYFCVDELLKRIYGITVNPEYSIVYFDY